MEENYLAHFKYSGQKLDEGYFDAKKSADALLGTDELLKFFLRKKLPELSHIEFELPVKINKGSWTILIVAGFIVKELAMHYGKTAVEQMAKNDVGDKGFAEALKSSIKHIRWCIAIAKHISSVKRKEFNNLLPKEINGKQYLGIRNENGEILYVPKIAIELFAELPPHLFSKITKSIGDGQEFSIDFSPKEKNDTDDIKGPVTIDYSQREIFYKEVEPEEIIFPELIHGQKIELNGHVTRGNEKTNTIGFLYQDHILTCIPEKGNIKSHKEKLFTNCIIKGIVDRLDKEGSFIEKKPRIIYSELIYIKEDKNQTDMFIN